MNDDFASVSRAAAPPETDAPTLGMSAVYKLFEAFIALREKNDRQHKLFEQTLTRANKDLSSHFHTFAAETQKAFQSLRQEIHGEKKVSLALLNELLESGQELQQIVDAKPELKKLDVEGEAGQILELWMQAVEVQNRKMQTALTRHGIFPYDAAVGAPYNPALHERVGCKRVDGMDALRIAEQIERGYASQQPEFVLRRPKVIVTE